MTACVFFWFSFFRLEQTKFEQNQNGRRCARTSRVGGCLQTGLFKTVRLSSPPPTFLFVFFFSPISFVVRVRTTLSRTHAAIANAQPMITHRGGRGYLYSHGIVFFFLAVLNFLCVAYNKDTSNSI